MKKKPAKKPSLDSLARRINALRTTILNQMALIRLDIVTEREKDRAIIKTLADHCARLLKEKETLSRQLSIEIAKSYTVTREEVIDETDYSALKPMMKFRPGTYNLKEDADANLAQAAAARFMSARMEDSDGPSYLLGDHRTPHIPTLLKEHVKAYVDHDGTPPKVCAFAHTHRLGIRCAVCRHLDIDPASYRDPR